MRPELQKNLTVEELCARFAIGRTTFFNLMKTHFGRGRQLFRRTGF